MFKIKGAPKSVFVHLNGQVYRIKQFKAPFCLLYKSEITDMSILKHSFREELNKLKASFKAISRLRNTEDEV